MNKKNKNKNLEEKNENDFQLFYAIGLVSKLGFSIMIIVGVFLYIGIILDRSFGTGFVFSALFLVASIPVSVYDIYFLLEPIIGSEKRKNFLKRKKKN